MQIRPVLIRSEDQIVSLLRGRRQALGYCQAELDDRIGWACAYTSKVEAPHRRYGRRVFVWLSGLADEWLEALGLALVLMDRADAKALCEGSAGADMTTAQPLAYAGRAREGGVIRERRIRIGYVWRDAA